MKESSLKVIGVYRFVITACKVPLFDNLFSYLTLKESKVSYPMSSKILIVDDSPVIRNLIRLTIQANTDWIVCGEAENGKIAVALVGELRPHLVILDLSMPVMNGLDAAREISRITPGMPMIMFTMHLTAGLQKDAERVGIKQVFSKEKGFGDNVFEAMREMLSTRAA